MINTKLKNLLTTALLVIFTSASADVRTVSVAELEPQSKHIRASELITHILTTYHYKKTELDDSLSSSIYKHYLENLDQNKAYFLKSDIQEFERYRFKIDDAIMRSDLSPAFEIFKRYRQRVDERINYAINTLNQNFNFDVDESYRFDRREDDWFSSSAELDTLWRKRVKNDVLNLQLTKKEPDEIKKTLTARYERIRSSTFQLNSNDVFQSFINAYTTSIEPHTAYFSPRTSENFDISMRLSLEGIGAVLRGDNDYTQVVKVITGGPADLSDELDADDRIIGVGQDKDGEIIDVIGWRLDDVVDLIRGPKGTIIKLEILPKGVGPEGPSKIITMTREKIKLEEQDASSSIIDIPESHTRIGVIELPTFYIDFAAQAEGKKDYKSTSRDVRKLIKEMLKDNIDGLIIDLRNNGGGSLSEALELTGLFIDRGPVVQTKDASGRVDINYDPEPGISYPGPLAVLVDRNSASASEIFAGAIQDYHRGIIVGEPTFGKGTVQNVIDLNRFIKESNEDHGRLKTTIAQFFRVSGGSNQHKGVIPDIIFPTAEDASDQGERAYKNALPWDQVKAAKYYPASAPVDSFIIAKKEHEKRIKTNKLFQLLMDDIYLQREASDRKEIPLLKSKRKAEREKILAAKKDIQNAMRAEKGLPPLKDDEDIDLSTSEDEEDEAIDILLNETAEILNDLIKPPANKKIDTRTVKTEKKVILNNNL
ncbi:MAG: carboxy terminal-processing peptidase [Proteobacteria bacterium]|nr:tail-specific protease [Pseudomonadota bacterium]NOG60806.1 carboxy terminal-processing peptidase [Pseudomonadota bacterium]